MRISVSFLDGTFQINAVVCFGVVKGSSSPSTNSKTELATSLGSMIFKSFGWEVKNFE